MIIALANCLRPFFCGSSNDDEAPRSRRSVMSRFRDSFTIDRRRALADVRDSDLEAGEAEWKCQVCGHQNAPRKGTCVLCGTEKPATEDKSQDGESKSKLLKKRSLRRFIDSFAGDKRMSSSFRGSQLPQDNSRSFSVSQRKVH